jgi:hypothetical protein
MLKNSQKIAEVYRNVKAIENKTDYDRAWQDALGWVLDVKDELMTHVVDMIVTFCYSDEPSHKTRDVGND